MKMTASVYAVIANGTERLADFDTRAEAEDRAAAEAEYGQEGERFEVRLLDRRRELQPDMEQQLESAGYDFLERARIRKANDREAYLKHLFR